MKIKSSTARILVALMRTHHEGLRLGNSCGDGSGSAQDLRTEAVLAYVANQKEHLIEKLITSLEDHWREIDDFDDVDQGRAVWDPDYVSHEEGE